MKRLFGKRGESLEDKLRLFRENYKGQVQIDNSGRKLKIGRTNYTLSQNFTVNGREESFKDYELRSIAREAKRMDGDLKTNLRQAYTAAVYDKIQTYEASQKKTLAKRVGLGLGVAALVGAASFGMFGGKKEATRDYIPSQPTIEERIEEVEETQGSLAYTQREAPTKDAEQEEIYSRLNDTLGKVEEILSQINNQYTGNKPALQTKPQNPPTVPQIASKEEEKVADNGITEVVNQPEVPLIPQVPERQISQRMIEMGNMYLRKSVDAYRDGKDKAGMMFARAAGTYLGTRDDM